MAINVTNLASQGLTMLGQTLIRESDARKQQQLQQFVARLELEQARKLESQLIKAQSEIERQRILFQAMALERNNQLKVETSKQKSKSVVVLSLAVVVFGVLIFISRKR